MLRQFFAGSLRAAGTWLGTPVGLIGLWLLADWFFSTGAGVVIGLVGGSLALLGLACAVAGFSCIVKDQHASARFT